MSGLSILQIAHDHPDWTPGRNGDRRARPRPGARRPRGQSAAGCWWQPRRCSGQAAKPAASAPTATTSCSTPGHTTASPWRGSTATPGSRRWGGCSTPCGPDVVHLHGLDRIGAEIVPAIRRLRPSCRIVLTLHDYQLICPNDGLLLDDRRGRPLSRRAARRLPALLSGTRGGAARPPARAPARRAGQRRPLHRAERLPARPVRGLGPRCRPDRCGAERRRPRCPDRRQRAASDPPGPLRLFRHDRAAQRPACAARRRRAPAGRATAGRAPWRARVGGREFSRRLRGRAEARRRGRAALRTLRPRRRRRARAREAREFVLSSSDWEAAFKKYSDGGGATEGVLSGIAQGDVDTAFSNAAFSLEVDEVSHVVESPRGFHIILRKQ